MDDGTPGLEVGFSIDTAGSFESLTSLDALVDRVTASAVEDIARVERASRGMLNLGSATASVTSFGAATSRVEQALRQEKAATERVGERLIKQLEREAGAIGKTRDEMRDARVEATALTAAQQGNSDLADRLFAAARQRSLAAEAAAEAEAAAIARTSAARTAEANTVQRAAREHAQLAAMVRGSHAAQEADAAAADRLRMATDPLYAATKRLNDEIAESTRLYHAGATAPAEYARQQEVLQDRLRGAVREHGAADAAMGRFAGSTKLAGHHSQNLVFQLQDMGQGFFAAAASSEPMKMVMMTLMQQGLQIKGIMMQAGIGVRGLTAEIALMTKTALLATATNPWFLAIAGTAALAAGAIKLLQSEAKDGGDMKKYAASLGLTAKEIRNLDNVTVTFGDTAEAVFQVAGRAIWDEIGPTVKAVWAEMKEWLHWVGGGVKTATNFLIGGFVGAYNAITKTWTQFPAVMGDVFYSAVNASIGAINALVRKAVEGLNWIGAQANRVLPEGMKIPTLEAGQIEAVNNQYKGAFAKIGTTATGELKKALAVDYVGAAGSAIGGAISAQARKNAEERIKKQATDKGYLDPEKGKTDKHAEQLAREAQAVEAQIRNLYALADAYGVSGAAALLAEARVKAESAAIKKRADIEELVARQVRLAIAQRVSDSAKSTATMREQAEMQEQVNAQVAAGTVPAERAADLLRDRLADLPLLAALEAAHHVKDLQGIQAATDALDKQRATRDRLTNAERAAQLAAAKASGQVRLAELAEELRLVGATEAVRVHALATLRATREVEAKGWTGKDAADHIARQAEIADLELQLRLRTDAANNSLTYQADLLDLIAGNVQRAGQGIADAFGEAGRALGDLSSSFAGYLADQARLKQAHDDQLRGISLLNDENQKAQRLREVNTLFAVRSSAMQVGLYGDMASAAKGFFKEGTSGYEAMKRAEQVFRAVEFAMSVRSIAQDAIETGSSIAKSGARAAAHAVEAVAKAIASMPFPLNLAAGAATVAALASIGLSIAGSFGGSGSKLEPANEGTGTVLGDSAAKSESIKRAIDALKDVDTLTNSYAREMSASLRSIDSQIGGFAALIVRSGDINASAGVTEGFKTDTTGKLLSGLVTGGGLLSKIPVLGGIIGGIGSLIGSLFGSTTKVVGSGLYGKSQSVGSVLSGGFDASYYSDVEKQKKFLGIKTGTSTSTQYSNADAGLEKQFTLILRSFNDAIAAAAGPLGESTAAIQGRLNSFVVNIGKIDLKGLTGSQIEEKLTAIFGAAADGMAAAAFPGLAQFQKVGEGTFETLVRVASTIEAVGSSLDMLGRNAQGMGIAAKLGLADQFDSVSDLTSAAEAYFQGFYTKEEQAAAKSAQLGRVFTSLGLTMPGTLAAFRQLVEVQDLTTAAGQATYATLLKLAPAFADLQASMEGAKSAADILSERTDLERQLLELQGNTAAIRELELAKLDASNRALQQQIWAIQDAQEAARAADELRSAWKSVGESIMDEVKRIRGLTGSDTGGGFASLMGQFNAATAAARGGDQDAAKGLTGLSQSLLAAAEKSATSRQELDRIRAQTASSLEATFSAISRLAGAAPTTAATTDALLRAVAGSQPGTSAAPANDDLASEVRALREEVAGLRSDNNAGHAATAANTGAIKRKLEDVTQDGNSISVSSAA